MDRNIQQGLRMVLHRTQSPVGLKADYQYAPWPRHSTCPNHQRKYRSWMLFQELPNDRAVLPLLLYIQEWLGFWGDRTTRVRHPVAFVAFWITVAIPKLATDYSDVESFICSMAELAFVGNVFCGGMALWSVYDAFRQFIEQVIRLTKYFIVPMMFTTACTVHVKVLTIACSVRYAEMLLQIVILKLDNLHRMPNQKSIRKELHDIIHAVELSKSVYGCGWPAMDRDIQQGLRMVLHRTQSPVGIQAGKFCFVDVELFQNMINKSYSFFIVLKDAF
uniref:Uncharacterized protein n=1 Tax=Anopheles merus TaxID=30066 RepID=A0A182VHG1_ANOME